MKYLYCIVIITALSFKSFDGRSQICANSVDSLGMKQGMWREFKIPFDIMNEDIEIKVPRTKEDYYSFSNEKHRRFFPIIECIGIYIDNLKNGIWIEYYSNGNKKSQVHYKKGIPSGECSMFWENGTLKMKCQIEDQEIFLIEIYDKQGQLCKKQMANKREVIKAIYEN